MYEGDNKCRLDFYSYNKKPIVVAETKQRNATYVLLDLY